MKRTTVLMVLIVCLALYAGLLGACQREPTPEPRAQESIGYTRLLELITGYFQPVGATILVDSDEAEVYGVQDATLIAANNVTATQSSGLVTRAKTAKGMYLFWRVTGVLSSTGEITLTVQAYDPAGAAYTTLYNVGPYTTTRNAAYLFYPEATDTGSALTGIVKVPLPARYRALVTVGPEAHASRTFTYSVGVSYVP